MAQGKSLEQEVYPRRLGYSTRSTRPEAASHRLQSAERRRRRQWFLPGWDMASDSPSPSTVPAQNGAASIHLTAELAIAETQTWRFARHSGTEWKANCASVSARSRNLATIAATLTTIETNTMSAAATP